MLNSYLIIINILSLNLFTSDKLAAVLNKRRIPEKVLLFVAFIGGSIGSLLGMILCRHKIRKKKFIITIPILCIVQLYLYYLTIKG